MTQEKIWEKEYRTQKLVTLGEKPGADFLDFLRFLRREQKIEIAGLNALDLGSGTGKNSQHLAELGASGVGYEISDTALALARERAARTALGDSIGSVTYEKRDIGVKYPLPDNSIDLIIDIMSSNSLDEASRATHLTESARVLKTGGWMFVRALCKDGDTNAKNLLKLSPGPEKDTYIMPELGLTERVWSKEDFIAAYSPFFDIVKLNKKTNYSQIGGRSYKRNFWLAYLQKK